MLEDQQEYYVCRTPISPIRKTTSDSSEMVSQILFGEVVRLRNRIGNWMQITSVEDNYSGFVDSKQFSKLTVEQYPVWLNNRIRNFAVTTIDSDFGSIRLPMGCYISNKNSFHFGKINYHINSTLKQLFDDWKTYAESFLNTSYLWGGRTAFGIDCSGLSQQVMYFRGIPLPRDASQQVLQGKKIDFSEREKGDLAFFHNSENKVVHVGILLSENQIIHASGFVKIDDFTEEGIISKETNQLTHRLNSISRYI